MKIRTLELENTGCLADRSMEFSHLNIIYGENRTGKSTLVYAIFFALFGKHLNSGLRSRDLCRMGEKSARISLTFEENAASYRLCRFTDRMPQIYHRSTDADSWQVFRENSEEIIQRLIPLAAETAALSSFFRESELIYFLQDMPRYGKTLIQSLIGIDRVLILRSAFKKALGKAGEYRKAVQNAAPKQHPDPLTGELNRRQLERAEKEMKILEADYERLLQAPFSEQHTKYRLTEAEFKGRENELNILRQRKIPPLPVLEAELRQVEKKLADSEKISRSAEDMLRQTGALSQEKSRIMARIQKLTQLEEQSLCPLCEHPLESARLSEIIAHAEKEAAEINLRQKETENRLTAFLNQKKEIAAVREKAETLRHQIREAEDTEERRKELQKQVDRLASELREQAPVYAESGQGADFTLRRQKLEERRKCLQESIVQYKVGISRDEELLRRIGDNRKHMEAAERKVLLCKTAYQALDEAVQEMGSRLMEDVRESVRNWAGHFSFLRDFDIEISGTELIPIIQASGYQYKLNQMSKSERIFLYLMLKLAIGDALGHTGIFVLDDPADGLDHKRKKTLAYLLSEVAKKRQVIVTSNDREFAELFTDGIRIDLGDSQINKPDRKTFAIA